MIKHFFGLVRVVAKMPTVLFFRELLNFYPPSINLKYSEVASDLFIWRDVSNWDTYFNIAHLGPILNPYYKEEYSAIIELYDSQGSTIETKKISLVFGDSYLLSINDLLVTCKEKYTSGTFAVFHLANLTALFGNKRVCLAERGFVSYKRKSDVSVLRAYAHGNMIATGFCLIKNISRRLGVYQKAKKYYRQQLTLEDSLYSEIALVNFLSSDILVGLYQYKEHLKINLMEISIPPGGLTFLRSTSDFDLHFPIEIESNVEFLRPVVFKYYENHFDILHG